MQTIYFSFGKEVRVALVGPDQSQLEHVPDLAIQYGANLDKICIVKAPSNQEGRGYQTIIPASYGKNIHRRKPDVYAEGVILTEPGSAAIIHVADCPVLVLFELQSGRVVVTHAGRPAMTPSNLPHEPITNIVTKAYNFLVGKHRCPYVLAYITGSICPYCFPHEREAGTALIASFKQFGDVAFANKERGELDLLSLITHQLISCGVRPNRISSNKTCTYETPWLASYRRDRTNDRNAVVVVKH